MKKTIIFLISVLILLIPIITSAKTPSFYEAEYIPNIWMNKKNPDNNLIYYNQARFFRESNTHNIAYCIEPFIFFYQNQDYNPTTQPTNYTQEQITDMTLISHYGYGYKNHTEQKWYAITQFMIWKIAQPNGYYYFSNYKNGPEVNMFQEEMLEITNLVENHKKNTSFNKNIYYIVEGETLKITDTNNTLNLFKTDNQNTKIENNTLTISQLPVGIHQITLKKETNIHNKPILFYQSSTSQDLIDTGDPYEKANEITVNVINTSVKITKYDEETIKKKPQGDASLIGATYDLYTRKGKYLNTFTIENNNEAILKNLPIGTYYIKEKCPGTGYTLNNKKYYFSLSPESQDININVTNKVIKGKLKIKKEYGYTNNFNPEINISFNIYDKNNNLIKTIMTNEEGIAEIILPYGTYKITQLTTTEGYQKIEPITFEIKAEETVFYNLKDYKIPVPNTKAESIINKIIKILRKILCIKK